MFDHIILWSAFRQIPAAFRMHYCIHQGILFIFSLSLCRTFSGYKLSINVLSSSLNTINLCPFSNA